MDAKINEWSQGGIEYVQASNNFPRYLLITNGNRVTYCGETQAHRKNLSLVITSNVTSYHYWYYVLSDMHCEVHKITSVVFLNIYDLMKTTSDKTK